MSQTPHQTITLASSRTTRSRGNNTQIIISMLSWGGSGVVIRLQESLGSHTIKKIHPLENMNVLRAVWDHLSMTLLDVDISCVKVEVFSWWSWRKGEGSLLWLGPIFCMQVPGQWKQRHVLQDHTETPSGEFKKIHLNTSSSEKVRFYEQKCTLTQYSWEMMWQQGYHCDITYSEIKRSTLYSLPHLTLLLFWAHSVSQHHMHSPSSRYRFYFQPIVMISSEKDSR